MYKHAIIRINYMTYDLRRAQDSINVRTHPYLMTLGHEDGEEGMKLHPYLLRLISIYRLIFAYPDLSTTRL